MNNALTQESATDALAQLALVARGDGKVSICPPAEHLAAFIDDELDAGARSTMLAHLDYCAECREHWREVSDILCNPRPRTEPAPSMTTACEAGGTRSRTPRWFLPLSLAASFSAVAALSLVLLSTPKQLSERIDIQFASATSANSAISQAARTMPLPWDSAALGFSVSVPDQATRAFGTGVWLARSALTGDQTPPPSAFLNRSERPWTNSKLLSHLEFGRWATLLWSQLAANTQLTNLADHRAIMAELRAKFAQSPSQAAASKALQALDDIDEALSRLPSVPPARAQQQLQTRLAVTIHRLAPSNL